MARVRGKDAGVEHAANDEEGGHAAHDGASRLSCTAHAAGLLIRLPYPLKGICRDILTETLTGQKRAGCQRHSRLRSVHRIDLLEVVTTILHHPPTISTSFHPTYLSLSIFNMPPTRGNANPPENSILTSSQVETILAGAMRKLPNHPTKSQSSPNTIPTPSGCLCAHDTDCVIRDQINGMSFKLEDAVRSFGEKISSLETKILRMDAQQVRH